MNSLSHYTSTFFELALQRSYLLSHRLFFWNNNKSPNENLYLIFVPRQMFELIYVGLGSRDVFFPTLKTLSTPIRVWNHYLSLSSWIAYLQKRKVTKRKEKSKWCMLINVLEAIILTRPSKQINLKFLRVCNMTSSWSLFQLWIKSLNVGPHTLIKF